MKRILGAAVAVLVIGCSENTLTLQNMSSVVTVYVTFRAKTYTIPPATATGITEETVDDVPNGTYGYGAIVGSTVPVELGEGLSGDLEFRSSATKVQLTFGSYPTGDSLGTVNVWGRVSSSDPNAAIVGP